MIKYFFDRIVSSKLGNRLAMTYENWFIPPQNESLIEIKRKEFKERTKYLQPKILYTLSEEEKSDLRNEGYFVDLDKKTINEIKNFKLSHNRHFGQYRLRENYYNYAMYNTKYYYVDQNFHNFYGDPQFYSKIWRVRTRTKNLMKRFLIIFSLLYLHYIYKSRRHRRNRQKIKKFLELNPEKGFKFYVNQII